MEWIRRHLTFANVVSLIALFVALGGGAYAVTNATKNSVTSKSVKNESLKGIDVRNDSLTGKDVDEATLQQAQPPDATSGRLRVTDVNGEACNPTLGGGFVACGSVDLTLAGPGRLLGIGTGTADVPATPPGVASCQLVADGQPISGFVRPVIASPAETDAFSVVGVSEVLPAGGHTLGMACAESDGDVVIRRAHVAAVTLGPG